jgi:hypothetical protein
MNHPTVFLGKHPWSNTRVGVDWSRYLLSIGSPAIQTSEWVDATSIGFSLTGAAISAAVTSVYVAGGLDGETGYLENRVTFDDGGSAVYTIDIIVADKVPD